MSLLCDMKFMSRDKSVDLSCRATHLLSRDKSVDFTGVLSCHATLFECFDIIFSANDKFLACDVKSLICRFLDLQPGMTIY